MFISAKDEDKIHLLKERYQIDDAKAKDFMVKTDKKRSSYYNYYSSKKWGGVKSYDLCVNSSSVGIDGAVKVIRCFIEEKMKQL